MGGLALAGISASGSACAPAPDPDRAPSPLFSAIYDSGFPVSAAFGAAAARQGYPSHDIDGDVTELWMGLGGACVVTFYEH